MHVIHSAMVNVPSRLHEIILLDNSSKCVSHFCLPTIIDGFPRSQWYKHSICKARTGNFFAVVLPLLFDTDLLEKRRDVDESGMLDRHFLGIRQIPNPLRLLHTYCVTVA